MKKHKYSYLRLKEGRNVAFSCTFYKLKKSLNFWGHPKRKQDLCREMEWDYFVERLFIKIDNIEWNLKEVKKLIKSEFKLFAKKYNLKLEVR